VSQTVKEVLQSLVGVLYLLDPMNSPTTSPGYIDDGLVQTDKVGSSNCELTNYNTYTGRTVSHRIISSLLELSIPERDHRMAKSSHVETSETCIICEQVQNRYATAEAARDAATKQRAELRVLIEEEKAARPDNVCTPPLDDTCLIDTLRPSEQLISCWWPILRRRLRT
jgi:hypothetical protein